jgi:hypothetical protein
MKSFNVPMLVTGGGGYTKHNVARCVIASGSFVWYAGASHTACCVLHPRLLAAMLMLHQCSVFGKKFHRS